MNNNFKRKLLAGVLVPMFGLSAGAALAQSPTTPSPTGQAAPSAVTFMWDAKTFERLDKNNDGQLSREEAQGDPMMKDNWSKLDTGNKGTISRAEFEDYGRKLTPTSAAPKGTPVDGATKK